jgi:glucose/arabinose dehydrogenase
MRGLVVAMGVALLVSAAVGVAGETRGGAEAQAQRLALKQIGTFDAPTHVAHAPRRPRLLYVVEKPGTIRVVRRGKRIRRPFLDIRGRVRDAGEAGLLSVAFHPRFPRNRQFYVYYVSARGNIQVDRFRSRRGTPLRAAPRSRRSVITVPHTRGNHFGGQLGFGRGGLLYVGTGDGGGSGDPDENAQDRRSLLGKLLRIKPRPRGGHRSPRGNPFVGGPGRDQIFSLGLRNPWRFSLDRRTNDLWIADVGQNRWEEVNRVSVREGRGANFGWNCREGTEAFAGASAACAGIDPSSFTEPVHTYPIFGGRPQCAIVGGHVVRDRGPAPLRGRYVYGDHCSGEIHSLAAGAANPSATDRPTGLRVGQLSSFGEGRRGWTYLTSLNGTVHRIVSR